MLRKKSENVPVDCLSKLPVSYEIREEEKNDNEFLEANVDVTTIPDYESWYPTWRGNSMWASSLGHYE